MQDNERAARHPWRIAIRPHPALTKRQNELALLLAEGLTISEMAEALQVERATVNSHIRRMAARLDVPPEVAQKRVIIIRHLVAYSHEAEQQERAA